MRTPPGHPDNAKRYVRVNDREFLVAIYLTIERLEDQMSELQTAVTDLKASVTDLSGRITTQVGPLQEALAAAQQSLADLTVVDEADKAALAQSITDAQTAAGQIEGSVTDLNAMAQPTP